MKAMPEEIQAYFAKIERDDLRMALADLRLLLTQELPDAEEVISYGMPAFRLSRPILYYGAFSRHCSLFLGGSTHQFAAELEGFKTSKGTIQFTPARPIPEALLRKMVKRRLAEIQGSD